MPEAALPVAPGAHVEIRDAVWRVVQVTHSSTGGRALRVIGVSEVVREREAIFLDEYEATVRVLDPAEAALVHDPSAQHRGALLYIESLLREVPPDSDDVRVGHLGALDAMPFQLEPARLALQQLRPRILIADAVGLGKTLEAGILLSELIRRGRGRRILVVTVKSMLVQFQKELWSRFTIPLVRLDSIGIQRVRDRIPTNHNPFYYYDRAIISMDTLKGNDAYSRHIEKAHWDVIVIDEAHNVAERGADLTQRARLASLLAKRSDALILLSATPHDGRPRSFASLMNMLDETAIANPEDYGPSDIKGLFIRRFKHDVATEVKSHFPERKVAYARQRASAAEESAFTALAKVASSRLNRRAGSMLFRTSLEKALLSSPAACTQTLTTRLTNLEADFKAGRRKREEWAAEVRLLEELRDTVSEIGVAGFSRYQRLLGILSEGKGEWAWTGKDATDRMVIFTESVKTLEFLEKNLPGDLGLPKSAVAVLHGAMSDVEQGDMVKDFANPHKPIRLLICSDVASEGINLHFLCHRMIHFDLPWSLMVYQQRNGRIDRYGQEKTPLIQYLRIETANEHIEGEQRILTRLAEKDEAAAKNIDDPLALSGAYDVESQEAQTAQAIEEGLSDDAFDALLAIIDPLDKKLADAKEAPAFYAPPRPPTSLFRSDFDYLRTALDVFQAAGKFRVEPRELDRYLEFDMPPDLERRLRMVPSEALNTEKSLCLTADPARMQRAIRDARADEGSWPKHHFLWALHPVMGWVADRLRTQFGRHSAPVIGLTRGLAPGERVIVVSGLVPNRQAQPVLHRWYAAVFRDSAFARLEDLDTLLRRTELGSHAIPNVGAPPDLTALQKLLPTAIEKVRARVIADRAELDAKLQARMDAQLGRLSELQTRKKKQVHLDFAGAVGQKLDARTAEERRVDEVFNRFVDFVESALTTEPNPFLQVVAALTSVGGQA